jgi:hypothetical protein
MYLAMAVYKTQGQTFDLMEVYLPTPIYSHGHIYVAVVTVRRCHRVKVKVTQSYKRSLFSNTTEGINWQSIILFIMHFCLS